MDAYFSIMFDCVRHERSLKLLLSLTDPDLLKRSKLTEHEMNLMKNPALEKLQREYQSSLLPQL